MSIDGCEPVPTADSGMAVDYDGDGYAETLLSDQDGDGYHETLYLDRDLDGLAEEAQQDTDLDGRVDTQIVDDDGDGIADRTFVDTDGDGVLEQQGVEQASVIPAGQPGTTPEEQPGQGDVPADFSGPTSSDPASSDPAPADLAQWLNDPNVQANPELEALIKRMLNFNTDASQTFLTSGQ